MAVCVTCVTADFARGEDWPQYRGSQTDGIIREQLTINIPANGPKPLWKVDVKGGFSSIAVAKGKALTQVIRDLEGTPMEMTLALDANSGKELWVTPVAPGKYPGGGDSGAPGNTGGDGPRSTPTISGDRVFIYTPDMVLFCLDLASGKTNWTKDIVKEYTGNNIGWKSALSPAVDGDLVYIAGGGTGSSLLAFRQDTGALTWKTGDEKMTHATPVVTTLHDVRQVLFMMQSGVVSVESKTGKELWRFAHPYRTSTACSPVVSGDKVFVTAGYEVGGAACEVLKTGTGFEAKELWRIRGNSQVASLWSPPVAKGNYLYGMFSFKQFANNGPFKCVSLKDGSVVWKQQAGFGAGNVILTGETLIALTDDGHVVLLRATPEAYQELGRFKAVNGKCWSTPALSNGKLYLRSSKEAVCFDLSK